MGDIKKEDVGKVPGDEPLFNPQEGIRGYREGGPYLDEVEMRREEDKRAAEAGRKPDYTRMPQLVPANQLVDAYASNPSAHNRPGPREAIAEAVVANVDNEQKFQNPAIDVATKQNHPANYQDLQDLHNQLHGEPVTGQPPGAPGSLDSYREVMEDNPAAAALTTPLPVAQVFAREEADANPPEPAVPVKEEKDDQGNKVTKVTNAPSPVAAPKSAPASTPSKDDNKDTKTTDEKKK
jgi:hypothetical protein